MVIYVLLVVLIMEELKFVWVEYGAQFVGTHIGVMKMPVLYVNN